MKMKQIFSTSLLTAAMTAPFQSFAVSTDLKITGEIRNTVCDITLSNSSIDFGDISLQSISHTAGLALPKKEVPMTITCPSPTYIATHLTDNRHGTLYNGSIPGAIGNSESRMGLNLDQTGKPIGFWAIDWVGGLQSPKVNGENGTVMFSYGTTSTSGWSNATINIMQFYMYSFKKTSESGSVPSPIENLTATLGINAYIAPRDDLDTQSSFNLDGSATIEVRYL